MSEHQPQSLHDDIEAVLRLADLPRPAGEQHDMEPAHDLCLGDDPCVCIQLVACEQRVLDAAREAVEALTTDLALSDQDTVVYRADALAAIDALREREISHE